MRYLALLIVLTILGWAFWLVWAWQMTRVMDGLLSIFF